MAHPEQSSPAGLVHDHVARGERARRGRLTLRLIARVAPMGAGVALLLALIGRFAGWRPIVPVLVLVAIGIALLFAAWLSRRVHAVTDATAAAIDRDAALGGELRSAHWFASQPVPDPWSTFHLERAATRITAVTWREVYPPIRSHRQWAGAAVISLGVVLLAWRAPAARPAAGTPGSLIERAAAEAGLTLPPDLARRLDELLADAKAGTMSAADAKKLADLSDLFAKLDPKTDPQLAKLAEQLKKAADAVGAAPPTSDQLAKAQDATGAADDLKQAMEDMASKLGETKAAEQGDQSGEASANADATKFGKSSSPAKAQSAEAAETQVQLVREAAGAPDKAQAMLGGGGATGLQSGAGRSGNPPAPGTPGDIAKADALRKEMIEAQADALGQNVTKEDLRRKTEQGRSGLTYTRTAAPAAVEKSRAVAAPPVPDARRTLVQSYFIRRS